MACAIGSHAASDTCAWLSIMRACQPRGKLAGYYGAGVQSSIVGFSDCLLWSAVARHRFGCLVFWIRDNGKHKPPRGVEHSRHSVDFLRGDKHLKIVENAQLIGFETRDRLHLGGCGRALEPGRRTPAILVGHA